MSRRRTGVSSCGEPEGAHQVRTGQVLVGRVDAVGVFAGDVHEVGEARARRHVDGVEAVVEEIVHGERLADDGVELELHAHLREVVHLGLDDVLGEAELGDAVDEDAARLVEGLEHDGLVAEAPQIARAGQARRARPDDCHARAGRGADGRQLDASLLALPVREKGFDLAHRNGKAQVLVDLGHHAVLLALALLRADAAADRRQEVGLLDEADGGAEVSVRNQSQEARHVDGDRAA